MVPGKTGEAAGEIGIEGTAIEAPTEASAAYSIRQVALYTAVRRFPLCVSTMYVATAMPPISGK